MSDEREGDQAPPEPDWQRRRRLAAVFGEVLPDTTGDERDPGTSDSGTSDSGDGDSAGEKWLRDQVPPHHGS